MLRSIQSIAYNDDSKFERKTMARIIWYETFYKMQ